MGNIVASCTLLLRDADEKDLLMAIGEGNLQHVKTLLGRKPNLVNGGVKPCVLPLHHAASLGQSDVLSLLLASGANVDALNHQKQTPLMLACKNGRAACIERLVEWGANVLMFDASHERTCAHYTAKCGHLQCLQIILNAAQSSSVTQTWGFARFVNVRDGTGATPLHLAATSCHTAIVRLLLSKGALVCATTTKMGKNSLALGSTPLHFAARGGSTECIKELLAWGADRLQTNSQGRTPFYIAMKYRNFACAALLNPMIAEPLVWPSPWKFMNDLDPEARVLLEAALAQATHAWEKRILSQGGIYKTFSNDIPKHVKEDDEDQEQNQDEDEDEDQDQDQDQDEEDDLKELCCICFERACTIEVRNCGHQMCASCTLALCCHNKPNPIVQSSPSPACPFCRCKIEHLKLARPKHIDGDGQGDKADEKQQVEANGKDKDKLVTGTHFMGLVSKGSFRLLSSARASNKVIDLDWQKESSSEQEIPASDEITCST